MSFNDIKIICSLGTGTMGPGTAVMFALAGYSVRMFGRTAESIERGFKGINTVLQTYKEYNLVSDNQIPQIQEKIKGTTTLEEAAEGADFIIESVAEDLAVKQEVFAILDKVCSAHTIFASSTSGLSPSLLAEVVKRKDKFIIAHFMNPPHLMPIVEVVPGKFTSQETLDITLKLIERIGKKPAVLKREAPGFIANRLQFALLREALYIVEQGIAAPETVDMTMKCLSRRFSATGPLEGADLGGLDIFYNIANYLMQDLCSNPATPQALAEAKESGNLGAKTGKGFYDWSDGVKLNKINKFREKILMEWLQKDSLNSLEVKNVKRQSAYRDEDYF